MEKNYIDNTYSGKYYIYKSKPTDEIVLFRTWFQRRYLFNWLYITAFILIVSWAISYLSEDLVHGSSALQAFYLLMPSTAATLILGLSIITVRKLQLTKNDTFVRRKILNLPWIIGELPLGQGYLMINLDLEEDKENLTIAASALIKELDDVEGFESTAALLLKIHPGKSLNHIIKQKDQFPRILAVLEIMSEQNAAGNRNFFTQPDPLSYFVKISH